MSFDIYYSCKHQPNQDIEYFHHPKKFPPVLLQFISPYPPLAPGNH